MSKPASERVALVVRAGSQFGEAVALELTHSGVRVALNDLLPDRIERIAKQIESAGGVASANPADLTHKLTLQTMLQDILEAWGRIDILIFLASVQPPDALLDMDEWDWHRALDQNLTAAFLCTQSVGRTMREIGGGTIIYILAGDETKSSPSYAAAAAGLRALSAAVAPELASHNIKIHAVDAKEITAAQVVALCANELAATK